MSSQHVGRLLLMASLVFMTLLPGTAYPAAASRSATIIDLDSARRGGHEEDLGCLAASVAVLAEDGAGRGSGTPDVEAFLAGYEDLRRPPDARAVALHEVGFRLRKAVDPFRECAPDWRERVAARVHAARGGLDELPPAGRSSASW